MAKEAFSLRRWRCVLVVVPILSACDGLPVNNHGLLQGLFTGQAASVSPSNDTLEDAIDCSEQPCQTQISSSNPWIALHFEPAAGAEEGDWHHISLTDDDRTYDTGPERCKSEEKTTDRLPVTPAELQAHLTACLARNTAIESDYHNISQGLSLLENAVLEHMISAADQAIIITELQMALLERQAQVNQLSLEQEATLKELIRTQAKLRSRNSRADTAILLAEAALTLQNTQTRLLPLQPVVFERSQKLLDQAKAAFSAENYDSAAFLARQSMTGIQSFLIQGYGDDYATPGNQVDQLFAIPLQMQVLESSPIRATPSMQGDILAEAQPNDHLIAIGYKGTWLRVSSPTDPTQLGWMSYEQLALETPETLPLQD